MRLGGMLIVCSLIGCAADSGGARRPSIDWDEMWPELVTDDPDDRARAELAGRFPLKRLAPEQGKELIELENAYRRGDDDEFRALREALDEDPIETFWLARMLVRYALVARDRGQTGTGALVGEPTWARPQRLLVEMGPSAVPCVVLDLLGHPHLDRREFAAEVLVALGPDALATWQRVFTVRDPKVRRKAMEILANFPGHTPVTRRLLEDSLADDDFGVRAAAYRGFARCGDDVEARLLRGLQEDRDPFVRRAIVESLATTVTPDAASAVVDFLEDRLEARDRQSTLAAEATLRKMSGRTQRTSLATWRAWAASLSAGGGATGK